jgi:2-C-methyl-D-erythritol 4-phosphate cytidylyltransferase
VAAGGIGERARRVPSDAPKQFVTLAGRPLFHFALHAVRDAGCDPLVLVVPPGWEERASAALPEGVQAVVVAGGETRQHSVGNGLERVDTERVVVHDAARPLATAELVRSLIEELDDAEAVLAAVPVDETLKQVDDGNVVQTVDRTTMWRSQTPAAFRTEALKDAHRRAAEEGFVGTDESQLVERYGGRVRVVRGSRANLKVTFPEDFALAEAMLTAGLG